jgi:protein-tyrosine phosphatase
MIDLHAHILPGFDDGAVNMDEAIRMCRIAESDGISAIVATPHTGNGTYINRRDRILDGVSSLNVVLGKEGINVEVLPGADVHVRHDITGMLADGDATGINDKACYILIELPNDVIPPNLKDWIFSLKVKGITPIISHPERNLAVEKNMEELRTWVKLGALVQITAMSVTGEFGDPARKSAHRMLKENLAHVIATDAHSPVQRPPILSEARNVAAELIGRVAADNLVEAYPRMVIEGRPIDASPPTDVKSGPVRRFFRRRLREG